MTVANISKYPHPPQHDRTLALYGMQRQGFLDERKKGALR
jgi:hypothetical protein